MFDKIKTFIRDWQGLGSGIFAAFFFAASPYIVQSIWPTDPGVMPGSYFQIVSLAAMLFFISNFLVWVAYAVDFWRIDKSFDHLQTMMNEITDPTKKICVTLAPFFLLLSFFAFCLWLAVKVLST